MREPAWSLDAPLGLKVLSILTRFGEGNALVQRQKVNKKLLQIVFKIAIRIGSFWDIGGREQNRCRGVEERFRGRLAFKFLRLSED